MMVTLMALMASPLTVMADEDDDVDGAKDDDADSELSAVPLLLPDGGVTLMVALDCAK